MDSGQILTTILLLSLISGDYSQSLIQLKPEIYHSDRKISLNDGSPLYCNSWRLSVETNNAGRWTTIPDKCLFFVQDYVYGDQYLSDSVVAAADSLKFALTVELAGDGKDAWVFDVDETLLSHLPYYKENGFISQGFDRDSWNKWVDLAEAPALPANLRFYRQLQELGFTLFLLTGRSESQRNSTMKNLLTVGYYNFERLLLRAPSDENSTATVFKSQKRKELRDEGYKIHGSSGDQWSDLLGFATAERSFKIPNPMYYAP